MELEDDAAHVHMGGDWHMPTPEQIKELINTANTTTAWTTSDGVSGVTFTSKSDASKSIFIPAAGYAEQGEIKMNTYCIRTWSSMLDTSSSEYGKCLDVWGSSVLNYYQRYCGYSVRGVIG